MFVEMTNKIKNLLDDPQDRVFLNNHVPEGQSANAQFLRYRHAAGTWELDLRVEFSKFKVILQEWQALSLLKSELGYEYTLSVVEYQSNLEQYGI